MSIVQVALLKQLLDNGSDAFTRREHYYVSIALIVTALSIQVLAGFVALYIAFMRKYMRNDKFTTGDFRLSVWPWRLKSRSSTSSTDIDHMINRLDGMSLRGDEGCWWWCPWQCQNQHFIYDSRDISHIDNYLRIRMLQDSGLMARYEQELKHAVTSVNIQDENSQQSQQRNGSDANESEQVQGTPPDASTRPTSDELKERIHAIEAREAQYSTWQAAVDALKTEMMMKQAETWQNLLNLMLYTVFVLNAFIACFGVGSTVCEFAAKSEHAVTTRQVTSMITTGTSP